MTSSLSARQLLQAGVTIDRGQLSLAQRIQLNAMVRKGLAERDVDDAGRAVWRPRLEAWGVDPVLLNAEALTFTHLSLP